MDELVDWAKFSQMRTELGASFVRILGYFREDGEKAVAKIEEAMHRGDAAGLVLPAHTLKAEARQFGAEPVAALAEEIEEAGRRAVEARLLPRQYPARRSRGSGRSTAHDRPARGRDQPAASPAARPSASAGRATRNSGGSSSRLIPIASRADSLPAGGP